MSHAAVQQCFETSLKQWADSQVPKIRIAFPNVSFTPTDAETYLRTHTIPADTRNDDVSLDTQTYVGIFQVDVVYPKNKGSTSGNAIIDELTNTVFRRNTLLTQGAFTLRTTSPVVPGPELEFDTVRMFKPCSINYWSRLVLAS